MLRHADQCFSVAAASCDNRLERRAVFASARLIRDKGFSIENKHLRLSFSDGLIIGAF